MVESIASEQHAHRSVRWQSNIRIHVRFALFAPSKPGSGRACRTGTGPGRSTRRTPMSSARIVKLAQRVPALVAWLRCCSYANTFVNPLPLCGFVNWYPIMRREAGALNVYPGQLERKSIRARQNNYKKPKLFCIN